MDNLTRSLLVAVNAGDTTEIDRLVNLINKEDDKRQAEINAAGVLKKSAEWYIRQGISVFPCAKKSKTPLTIHGFKDASVDPQQIHRWWARNPFANLGCPTGIYFDVIDIDGPAGYEAFAEMRAENLIPPILGRSITPSGGMHIFIPPSGDGNSTRTLDQIDYRGAGGYVLLPPSYVIEEDKGYQGRYVWTTRPNFKKLVKHVSSP